MSEPISIDAKTAGKTVAFYEPPRQRCKQGHEVDHIDALLLTITGRTRIVVGPTCPFCIAKFLREQFGMDPVRGETVSL